MSVKSDLNTKRVLSRDKKKVIAKKYVFVYSLLIIPLVNWLVFWFGVNIKTILTAFQDRFGEWSFANFGDVWVSLTDPIDPNNNIQVGFFNTLKYFISGLIVNMPTSLIVSYFLYKKIKLHKAFKVIFYLPAIVSGVVMVTVFSEFISPNGPLGAICELLKINLPPEGLLARDSTATWTIVVFGLWTGLSGNMLLFNGAMARIPTEVLEAAKLDGVGPFREIVSFILPLIWPTLSSVLVFAFVGVLGASGPILLFAPRGDYKTTTISYWIFYQVYGGGSDVGADHNIAIVSAAGLCFTAVSLPITFTVRWLAEKVETIEY